MCVGRGGTLVHISQVQTGQDAKLIFLPISTTNRWWNWWQTRFSLVVESRINRKLVRLHQNLTKTAPAPVGWNLLGSHWISNWRKCWLVNRLVANNRLLLDPAGNDFTLIKTDNRHVKRLLQLACLVPSRAAGVNSLFLAAVYMIKYIMRNWACNVNCGSVRRQWASSCHLYRARVKPGWMNLESTFSTSVYAKTLCSITPACITRAPHRSEGHWKVRDTITELLMTDSGGINDASAQV